MARRPAARRRPAGPARLLLAGMATVATFGLTLRIAADDLAAMAAGDVVAIPPSGPRTEIRVLVRAGDAAPATGPFSGDAPTAGGELAADGAGTDGAPRTGSTTSAGGSTGGTTAGTTGGTTGGTSGGSTGGSTGTSPSPDPSPQEPTPTDPPTTVDPAPTDPPPSDGKTRGS